MTRLSRSPVAGHFPIPDPPSGSDSGLHPQLPTVPSAVSAPRLRVLVVAADGALRSLLTDALQSAGFDVLAAVDPSSAPVATGAEGRLSLILLDLELARSAGRFRADWSCRWPAPHAPLVLLSTEDVAETVAAVESADAVGFLRLPCDLDDLLALVRRTALPLSQAPPVPPAPPVPEVPVAPRISGDAKARGAEAAEARRRRLLQRLARDVGELRPAVVKVRDELRALLDREQDGPLAPPEQRRLAALRREIEAQQLRLRECREEFERLRGAGSGPP